MNLASPHAGPASMAAFHSDLIRRDYAFRHSALVRAEQRGNAPAMQFRARPLTQVQDESPATALQAQPTPGPELALLALLMGKR